MTPSRSPNMQVGSKWGYKPWFPDPEAKVHSAVTRWECDETWGDLGDRHPLNPLSPLCCPSCPAGSWCCPFPPPTSISIQAQHLFLQLCRTSRLLGLQDHSDYKPAPAFRPALITSRFYVKPSHESPRPNLLSQHSRPSKPSTEATFSSKTQLSASQIRLMLCGLLLSI